MSTATLECFRVLSNASKPLSASEIARIVGKRQTVSSIKCLLWPYVRKGCIDTVECHWEERCKVAYVLVSLPSNIVEQMKEY